MLDKAKIEDFGAGFRGPLVRAGDESYDTARAVWNAMIDRRPALIASCTGAADVVAAVNFARTKDLLVAVRGGGHNIAGTSVCDDGLLIDLSLMKAVHVDPKARTAHVQAGAHLADVDHETQAFGLAVPGGVVSTTGVAGLTLGGGFGWLSRLHGLVADNLLSVDVVTAEGVLVTPSADDHADLFWGVRGGGGNFGVVTSFTFRLHPVGPQVLFGPTVYRLADAPDVLRHYRAFAAEAPRACCVWADLLTAPPLPFIPAQYHGTKILTLMQCYACDLEEGERVLAPLRTYGEPIADAVGPMPFVAAQQLLDGACAAGARNYWTSQNLTALSDGAIDATVALAETLPTPQSDILISQLGGAINDVAPDATAYPHRDVAFVISPGARWFDSAQDDACMAWIGDCQRGLVGHGTGGAYVNFIAEKSGREQAAYGPNYDKLVALKNKYDPTNLFRLNQNVRPTV